MNVYHSKLMLYRFFLFVCYCFNVSGTCQLALACLAKRSEAWRARRDDSQLLSLSQPKDDFMWSNNLPILSQWRLHQLSVWLAGWCVCSLVHTTLHMNVWWFWKACSLNLALYYAPPDWFSWNLVGGWRGAKEELGQVSQTVILLSAILITYIFFTFLFAQIFNKHNATCCLPNFNASSPNICD